MKEYCKGCGRFKSNAKLLDPRVISFIEKLAQEDDLKAWGTGSLGFQEYTPSSVELKTEKLKATPRYVFGLNFRKIYSLMP